MAVFSPRAFPKDPFPVYFYPSRLLPQRPPLPSHVLLILGDPPLAALAPFLHSPLFATSLLIIATNCNYSALAPHDSGPAVRILRLSLPLAAPASPPARLAAVLQWAQATAAAWLAAPPSAPRYAELSEPLDVIPAAPASPPLSSVELPSPSPSPPTPTPTPRNSILRRSHSRRPASTSASSASTSVPPSPPTGRTAADRSPNRVFDALLHFLPPDPVPPRHLLKHAILLTTLARPFLVAPPSDRVAASSASSLRRGPSRRFSFLPRRNSIPPNIASASLGNSLPTSSSQFPSAAVPAHIIHLIPPQHAALIPPLEAFCFSFAAAAAAASTVHAPPPSPKQRQQPPPQETPRLLLMPTAALAERVRYTATPTSPEYMTTTIAEVVLGGALTPDAATTTSAATSQVWIRGAKALACSPGDEVAMVILAPSSSPSTDGVDRVDNGAGDDRGRSVNDTADTSAPVPVRDPAVPVPMPVPDGRSPLPLPAAQVQHPRAASAPTDATMTTDTAAVAEARPSLPSRGAVAALRPPSATSSPSRFSSYSSHSPSGSPSASSSSSSSSSGLSPSPSPEPVTPVTDESAAAAAAVVPALASADHPPMRSPALAPPPPSLMLPKKTREAATMRGGSAFVSWLKQHR